MTCEKFQKLINDFVFDKLDDSELLEEFVEHAKECKECKEDLELYYSVRRGFGDTECPIETDEMLEPNIELEYVLEFYEKHFKINMFSAKFIFVSVLLLQQILQDVPPETTMPLTDQPNMPRRAAGRKDIP